MTDTHIYLCSKNPDMVTTFRYRTCHKSISDSNTPHKLRNWTHKKRTRVSITCTSRLQRSVPLIRRLFAGFPPRRPVFDPRSVPQNFRWTKWQCGRFFCQYNNYNFNISTKCAYSIKYIHYYQYLSVYWNIIVIRKMHRMETFNIFREYLGFPQTETFHQCSVSIQSS